MKELEPGKGGDDSHDYPRQFHKDSERRCPIHDGKITGRGCGRGVRQSFRLLKSICDKAMCPDHAGIIRQRCRRHHPGRAGHRPMSYKTELFQRGTNQIIGKPGKSEHQIGIGRSDGRIYEITNNTTDAQQA